MLYIEVLKARQWQTERKGAAAPNWRQGQEPTSTPRCRWTKVSTFKLVKL